MKQVNRMGAASQGACSTQRSFSYVSKVNTSPIIVAKQCSNEGANNTSSFPSVAIDFRRMVEVADQMQEYIAKGGANGNKKSESGEPKCIQLSGLFGFPRKS
ncbi:hypothetical protein [Spirosoma utsteinense]|uniref:Uncharacterized protein n=1 Tax=Spirosoma utsteinense TaxID=2585773 RepID=A0ABR6WBA7_9BACT|nr:hypothetical protein [Spirosoma utsteinense]MBC3786485.1 hypothetical protein [Spirosoma utsteinense]MBC3793802.1 hypothetical protein [Spirosoma utsteinense]